VCSRSNERLPRQLRSELSFAGSRLVSSKAGCGPVVPARTRAAVSSVWWFVPARAATGGKGVTERAALDATESATARAYGTTSTASRIQSCSVTGLDFRSCSLRQIIRKHSPRIPATADATSGSRRLRRHRRNPMAHPAAIAASASIKSPKIGITMKTKPTQAQLKAMPHHTARAARSHHPCPRSLGGDTDRDPGCWTAGSNHRRVLDLPSSSA
jgi:hypothetical protein